MSSEMLHGVIQGDTIRLDEPSHLPAGTLVRVIVVVAESQGEKLPAGEGLRRSYGAWQGDDEAGLDAYLEWSRQQRKQETHRELDP
jgi:hypothetical protein